MTSDDIKNVQIIATCKDGLHIVAISDDRILINCIVEWCQFVRLRDDLFKDVPLRELLETGRQ